MKILFLLCLFATNLYAWELKVVKMRGDVTFAGKKIKVSDILKTSGDLIVGEKSFVKFIAVGPGSEVVIGPKTNMKLELEKGSPGSAFTLNDGSCRWITKSTKLMDYLDEPKSASIKKILGTKTASLGLRGTDFLFISNELLGETEVVMFDGEVELSSNADSSSSKVLKKNFWGGVGGRFGEEVKVLPELPKNVVDHFKKSLE
jgi:hypothetical protein